MPATRNRKRAASPDAQDQSNPPKKTRQTKNTTTKQVDDDEGKEDQSAKKSKPAPKSKAKANQTDKDSSTPKNETDTTPTKTPAKDAKKATSKSKAKGTAVKSEDGKPTEAQTSGQDQNKDSKSTGSDESKLPAGKKVDGNIADLAKLKDLVISVDKGFENRSARVHIGQDGTIYDASLNRTNAGANNNKFYRLQLLDIGKGHSYVIYTRWGRVGENGTPGHALEPDLNKAIAAFEKKFKEKSGLKWADRAEDPKPGKYTFLERSYEPEPEEQDNTGGDETDEANAVKSQLEPAVQSLMSFIFNSDNMNSAMADMNYDAKKLPLGRLSETTILRAWQVLKSLSALLDDHTLAASEYNTEYPQAVERLSNQYYSFIPHDFKRKPPLIIDSIEHLKKEVLLLESLTELKGTDSILKAELGERMHILDKRFKGLGLSEMTPIDSNTKEYTEIEQYLIKTVGSTHPISYELKDVFRIERKGESDRYKVVDPKISDRRLLWHGSRSTNFGGILSQGLRIAPPEAPVSGYMFGKGVYLADMSSKSANYCHAKISQRHALLLLCEAELGTPMHELMRDSYSAGEDAKAKGALSTWGKGLYGPKAWKDAGCISPSLKGVKMPDVSTPVSELLDKYRASLHYNEYICYDVSQIRLRYLLRVHI